MKVSIGPFLVTTTNMLQMIHLIEREYPAYSNEFSLLHANSPREQTFPGSAMDLDAPSVAADAHTSPRTTVLMYASR